MIGRRVVVVPVFVRKTQKTPDGEIDLALKHAKEIGDEQGLGHIALDPGASLIDSGQGLGNSHL